MLIAAVGKRQVRLPAVGVHGGAGRDCVIDERQQAVGRDVGDVAQPDAPHVVMPGVHRVASLLDRWLLGTHQGSVSREHLDAYLNEFTFRFNRRRSRRRGLLFYRVLEQAIAAEPITYRSLIAHPSPTGRRPSLATQPGRVTTPPPVHRPWRQSPANAGLPDSNR